ncbi:MAG: hypothetical protein QXQ96_10620 [Sulfolobales archaeon]
MKRLDASARFVGLGNYSSIFGSYRDKCLVFSLSKVVDKSKMIDAMVYTREMLVAHGLSVVGSFLGLDNDDPEAHIFIAIKPGEILCIKIAALESIASSRVSEGDDPANWLPWLGSEIDDRGRFLIAAGIYFVAEKPEEEVFEEMVMLTGSREEAERIASLVWRIAFGEGYTLEQWADLLRSLSILSPWEAIWRFQNLVERGMRRRHNREPADLRDMNVLRTALKPLGTG